MIAPSEWTTIFYAPLSPGPPDPSVTDWMQGFGTIGGALLSGIAVLLTYVLLRHEIRTRKEEKRDAEVGQARLEIFKEWG